MKSTANGYKYPEFPMTGSKAKIFKSTLEFQHKQRYQLVLCPNVVYGWSLTCLAATRFSSGSSSFCGSPPKSGSSSAIDFSRSARAATKRRWQSGTICWVSLKTWRTGSKLRIYMQLCPVSIQSEMDFLPLASFWPCTHLLLLFSSFRSYLSAAVLPK